MSPQSQKVPLRALVRSVMCRLETETGYSLSWVAVAHHDTPNQHAHILVNGVDRITGKEIRIDRHVVRERIRTAAAAACRQLVGMPSHEEAEARRKKIPFANRWTYIDDDVKSVKKDFPVPRDVDGGIWETEVIARNDIMAQRLDWLVKIGFAKKYRGNIPPVYWLEKGWERKLKSVGRYNSFLTARAGLRYTDAANLEQYTEDTGPVEGIITHVFRMNDEDSWVNAIVIENKAAGKAYYLPLWKEPPAGAAGRLVRISVAKGHSGRMAPKIAFLDEIRGAKKT